MDPGAKQIRPFSKLSFSPSPCRPCKR
uniref:Uncharacterized protein n=1 Tax=Anguilla anguilla TaxID=7936 RepID=A0A0E9Q840_ANGAN